MLIVRRRLALLLMLLAIVAAWLYRRRKRPQLLPPQASEQRPEVMLDSLETTPAEAIASAPETAPSREDPELPPQHPVPLKPLARHPTKEAPRLSRSMTAPLPEVHQPQAIQQDSAPNDLKKYAAFVSHFKMEAAMEARYLQAELETELRRLIFLDRYLVGPDPPTRGCPDCPIHLSRLCSDDLHDLRLLKEAVRQSDVLILVQSARVLERPWWYISLKTLPRDIYDTHIHTNEQHKQGSKYQCP